jgi:hypothetical protein
VILDHFQTLIRAARLAVEAWNIQVLTKEILDLRVGARPPGRRVDDKSACEPPASCAPTESASPVPVNSDTVAPKLDSNTGSPSQLHNEALLGDGEQRSNKTDEACSSEDDDQRRDRKERTYEEFDASPDWAKYLIQSWALLLQWSLAVCSKLHRSEI